MFADHKYFKVLNVLSKVFVAERDRALSVKSIQNGYAGKAGVYFTAHETQKVYSIDDIVDID